MTSAEADDAGAGLAGAGPAAEPGAESYACPSCGRPVWPGDNFCESCSADLTAEPGASPALSLWPVGELASHEPPTKPAHAQPTAPPAPAGAPAPAAAPASAAPAPAEVRAPAFAACPSCPDATVSPEGYCENCGRKVPSAADHRELDLGLVAGVTDRGLRHRRNEDAMALATADGPEGPAAIAVVCDGISTSSRPDEAATAAAQAAVGVLQAAATAGDDLTVASKQAVSAAQEALVALAADEPAAASAPATTFVSAVLTAAEVTVCWIGDSRAYWLTDQADAGSRQLSTDDSIAQELVNEGLLTAAQALASPAGHVVTGWLGADLTEAAPHVSVFRPESAGVVLLCSDGLWNYRPEATELAASALPSGLTDPLSAAAALVAFAVESGGSDNITTVLAPFPPGAEPDHQDEGEARQ